MGGAKAIVLVLSATVLVLVLVLSATVLVLSATVLALVLERNVVAEPTFDPERLDLYCLSIDYVAFSSQVGKSLGDRRWNAPRFMMCGVFVMRLTMIRIAVAKEI